MTPTLLHGDAPIVVGIAARRPDLVLEIDGVAYRIAVLPTPDPRAFLLTIDGVEHRGFVYRTAGEVYVRYAGRTTVLTIPKRSERGGAAAGDDIRAEMPGVVVALHCVEGQAVSAGEKLVTIESMKLQTALSAPRDAVIDQIHVGPDGAFDRGAVLLSFQPTSESPR